MYEDLLPLGSVVLLAGADKRLMITSRIVAARGEERIYDYEGCLFPEGGSGSRSVYLFDDDDIDRIYFIGFQDGEELAFRSEVLASLGELYVNEEGEILERKAEAGERAETDEEAPIEADAVEPAIFAEV